MGIFSYDNLSLPYQPWSPMPVPKEAGQACMMEVENLHCQR